MQPACLSNAHLVAGCSLLAMLATSPDASAGEGRDAMDQAHAALRAHPPDREAARTSLERVIATREDPVLVSEALFRLAALDEDDSAYEHALEQDRASVAAAPASRWARSASARVSWLEERSDDHFVPFVRLMRAWQDPTLTTDPAALEAFARETDGFPPGTVRGEARMFIAETWLQRFARPERAEPELRQVIADPRASPQSRRFAVRDLTSALLAQGRLDAAEIEAHAHPSDVEAPFAARLERLLRRRSLTRAAELVVALSVLVIGGAWFAARRARPTPAAGSRTRRFRRAAVSTLAGVGLLAVAFLLVTVLRPAWLERLGL